MTALSYSLRKERDKKQSDLENCIQKLEQVHKRTNKETTLKPLNQYRQDSNDLLTY